MKAKDVKIGAWYAVKVAIGFVQCKFVQNPGTWCMETRDGRRFYVKAKDIVQEVAPPPASR